MLENYTPPYTATVVERLINAGGVLVGKTNMDEFCMGSASCHSIFGPVKNPWTFVNNSGSDQLEERLSSAGADFLTPGGSSGGSAVAVACGAAKIALGSDTGGSTRSPAAFCGVVGLKPTYGLLSRHGLIPLTNSLDCPALLARTVDDCAFGLDVTAGHDQFDSTSVKRPAGLLDEYRSCLDLNGLRIGIPLEYNPDFLSSEIADVWDEIAQLLASNGAKISGVSLPHTRHSIACYHVLGECDVASNMARYDGVEYGHRDGLSGETLSLNELYARNRQQGFNEVVRRRILAGNYFLLRENYGDYFERACKVRRLISADFQECFGNVDALLTPASASTPPLFSELTNERDDYARERVDDYFFQAANMAGVPALTVPIRTSKSVTAPISLQLIGNNLQEAKLLRIARWIEKTVDFPFEILDNFIDRLLDQYDDSSHTSHDAGRTL